MKATGPSGKLVAIGIDLAGVGKALGATRFRLAG